MNRTARPRVIGGDEVALFWANHVATHTDQRLFIAGPGNARILGVRLGYHATAKVTLKDVPDAADRQEGGPPVTRGMFVLACLACIVGCAATPSLDAATQPNPQRLEVEFHPLVTPKDAKLALPRRFSVFFGMLGHSNGKVYVGTCYHVARLVEFDPKTKQVRVVAMMSSRAQEGGGPKLKNPTLLGDLGTGTFPMTRWQFAQDKIHTQLIEGADGRVYGGTHTKIENADATRKYPGGHWFAYDPKTGVTEDLGWARRHEGIITCCMDKKRNVLYGITWPTGYFVRCRPGEKSYYKRLNTLGLACSELDCSPRYFDVVKDGRVYVPDGATGDISVYDPKTGRFHRVTGMSTFTSPDTPTGRYPGTLRATRKWRNWWMLGCKSPDGMHLFTTAQRAGHLMEIDAAKGQWGAVIDHGRTVPWAKRDWSGPWCGVMVFGADGLLYHTVGSQLLTFDRKTGRVLDWGRTVLKSHPDVTLNLGGGGALAADGKLYCMAGYKRQKGLAVIDPAQLKGKTPQLLRVSPRRVTFPLAKSATLKK